MNVYVAWTGTYPDGSGSPEILGVATTEDGAYALIGRRVASDGHPPPDPRVEEFELLGEGDRPPPWHPPGYRGPVLPVTPVVPS